MEDRALLAHQLDLAIFDVEQRLTFGTAVVLAFQCQRLAIGGPGVAVGRRQVVRARQVVRISVKVAQINEKLGGRVNQPALPEQAQRGLDHHQAALADGERGVLV